MDSQGLTILQLINKNKPIPTQITVKLQKTKDKEKIQEQIGEKGFYMIFK